LKAKIYLDAIFPSKLIVYPQGLHFTTWCSSEQTSNIVDFQKHEPVEEGKKNVEFTFPTKGGYKVVMKVTIMFKRRDTEEALGYSLKYQSGEIATLIKAYVSQAITSLGGRNSFEQLNYHRNVLELWIANLFGGKRIISKFEKETGTEILDPVMDSLNLTDEDQEIFRAKAKTNLVAEGIEKMKETDEELSPSERANLVKLAQKLSTEHINKNENTYDIKNMPDGLHTFAPGSSGVAVTNK